MDIFIETHLKINQDIQPDVDTLDTDQLIALRESLKTSEEMVSELTARARNLELIMAEYKNSISRRINRLELREGNWPPPKAVTPLGHTTTSIATSESTR
jgi:SMC interacting uncharacterized protein involved in chromosome segregation